MDRKIQGERTRSRAVVELACCETTRSPGSPGQKLPQSAGELVVANAIAAQNRGIRLSIRRGFVPLELGELAVATAIRKRQDASTRQVFAALKRAFPDVPDDTAEVVYRYNPVAIRIRVVSRSFAGINDDRRDDAVMSALKELPKDCLLYTSPSPRDS